MKDRFHQKNLSRYTSFELFLYELLDQFLILFIVSPSAVLVWRGSWKFFDEFLFPEYLLISGWVSVGIGYIFIIMTFLFVEWKGGDLKLFEKYKEWRLFMYPLSISVLHAWRGVWMLLDIYCSNDGYNLLISHVVSFVVLGLTKTVSNSMFIPAFYASDYCVMPFQIGTAFGTANTRTNPFYKIFDYLFTMTVITVSTVAFWRSSWTALNVYLFPDHEAFSNLLSIIVGYTIIASFKLIEGSLKSLAECSKVVTFILQAAFCYSMGFAAINLWRGTWQMIGLLYPSMCCIVVYYCCYCYVFIWLVDVSLLGVVLLHTYLLFF